MHSLQKWDELSMMLNSDGSGDAKSTEKWKKVWSDFKNNTKKKAACIHRTATGTGGGPAIYAKLGELEQRVLSLVGVQVATGLAVEEAGLSQGINVQPIFTTADEMPHLFVETGHDTPTQCTLASDTRAVSSPPLTFIEEEIHNSEAWNQPGPSTHPDVGDIATRTPPQARASPIIVLPIESMQVSPSRPSSQAHIIQPEPALFGQTTPRRTRRRP